MFLSFTSVPKDVVLCTRILVKEIFSSTIFVNVKYNVFR